MAFKIFYAWQSDRPNSLNRGLIRKALDDAVKELKVDPEVAEAERDIEIDQDTQGVPGSPSLAEAIFKKIRDCDAFVADLTFVGTAEDGIPLPNPNVLIEYGYALGLKSDTRIVGVFNSAYGDVRQLPFDLQHKRWPVSYVVSDDSDADEGKTRRRAARKLTASELVRRLRDILKEVTKASNNTGRPFSLGLEGVGDEEPQTGTPSLRKYPESIPHGWQDDTIGGRANTLPSDPHYWIKMVYGPHIMLKLRFQGGFERMSNVQTMEQVRRYLLPLGGARANGRSVARNGQGPVVFLAASDAPDVAISATQFLSWGELSAVDFHFLRPRKERTEGESKFVPTSAVEEVLVDGLSNAMTFARDGIKASLPIDVQVGLIDVMGYRLAVKPEYFHGDKTVGYIHWDQIGKSFSLTSPKDDPFELLLPFFNEIYDAADEVRPKIRTEGRLNH